MKDSNGKVTKLSAKTFTDTEIVRKYTDQNMQRHVLNF